MSYNFRNAFVCFWPEAPLQLTLVDSVPVDELKVLGIVRADGGYKVSADQKDMSSTNKKLVLTEKLEVNLEILTALAPTDTFLNDVDGKATCLVFVDSDPFPDLDTVNTSTEYKTLHDLLTAAGYALPENVTATVLTPKLTTEVREDVKYGSGKVVPYVIAGDYVARTKAELRKERVPVTAAA